MSFTETSLLAHRTALSTNRCFSLVFFVFRSWDQGPGCVFCCSLLWFLDLPRHVIQVQVDPASQGELRNATLIVMIFFLPFPFLWNELWGHLGTLIFSLGSHIWRKASISNSFFLSLTLTLMFSTSIPNRKKAKCFQGAHTSLSFDLAASVQCPTPQLPSAQLHRLLLLLRTRLRTSHLSSPQ